MIEALRNDGGPLSAESAPSGDIPARWRKRRREFFRTSTGGRRSFVPVSKGRVQCAVVAERDDGPRRGALALRVGRGAAGGVAFFAAFIYLVVGTALVWTAFALFNAAFGVLAGTAAAIFFAVPFALVASVIRGWSPRTKAGQLWIAGMVVEVVALALVLQFLFDAGWWCVAAIAAVALPIEVTRHAASLSSYEAFDLQVLLTRDAWLHPRRTREQRFLSQP